MGLLNRTFIRQFEIGLLFKRGDFIGILEPGKHKGLGPLARWQGLTVQVVKTLDGLFKHRHLDLLIQDEAFRARIHVIDLTDTQRAFVWREGRLEHVLGPGLHVLWREPVTYEIDIQDIGAFEVQHEKLDALLGIPASRALFGIVAPASGTIALVFRNGELVRRVPTGRFIYWKDTSLIEIKTIDLREQTVDVTGQEIMTRDKVTLRLNLVMTYRVLDPVAAVMTISDFAQALYRDAQLALRAAVGTRTLDALLANKETTGADVTAALTERAEAMGVKIEAIGIRDIILPGDMKTILNQVIEAQKQAEANTVRRREETAAARSQANTAKLLAENPVLARLKELELLQEVLAGAKATFVFGQGNDMLGQLEKLIDRQPTTD